MTRNKMMKDDFYASYLTKKTGSKMMKEEFFCVLSEKEEQYPTEKSRLTNYYQGEEGNTNVDD